MVWTTASRGLDEIDEAGQFPRLLFGGTGTGLPILP